ncbi:MAG: hypothetical protein AAGF12_19935 [Myxococcota bacterium]
MKVHRREACAWLAMVTALVPGAAAPGAALAQEPTVSLQSTGEADAPFRYWFSIGAGNGFETVSDRRLLEFRVRPEGSRRTTRCRHPERPSVVQEGRIKTEAPEREWIDLRMYCWGRARRALDGPGEIEVHYGFSRRGRRRWVVRSEGAEHHRIQGTSIRWPGLSSEAEDGSDGLTVSLRSGDVRSGAFLLSVSLRSEASTRVYLRNDLFRFYVRGPLGAVECTIRRQEVTPIIDFYSRIGGRRSVTRSVSAQAFCPQGFRVPGIYEITPVVDLIYGPTHYEIEVTSGTFEGTPTAFRVRRGGAYVEQVELPDARGEDEDAPNSPTPES